MGFFDKVKVLAEKTVEAAKDTVQATQEAYKEGGIEKVGFKAGQLTKGLVSEVSEYAGEIGEKAQKAGNRSALVFNKEQPNAQVAAKIALGVIAGMRQVGLDAANKIEKAADKFNNLEQESKPSKPKM